VHTKMNKKCHMAFVCYIIITRHRKRHEIVAHYRWIFMCLLYQDPVCCSIEKKGRFFSFYFVFMLFVAALFFKYFMENSFLFLYLHKLYASFMNAFHILFHFCQKEKLRTILLLQEIMLYI
jgi:hypothetical protein